MSAKSKLLDPLAGVLGTAVAAGAFFLIPGVAAALPAALGIGALVYGAKVAASSLRGAGEPRPAVGAGADHSSPARLKRGSRAELWHARGYKAIGGMDEIVTSTRQQIFHGQLENVVIEARDSLAVLDRLAEQIAGLERSLDQMPTASLRDQRERLSAALQEPHAPAALREEKQRALDAVVDQERTVARLLGVHTGLLGRMETIVLDLERLQSEMNETVASALTTVDAAGATGENHLRDLGDQLAGLRAGLEETRRYTAEVLGPDG